MGTYCPEGSITPTACGPGTFSSSTGNTNSSQCFDCTPGYYCPNATTAFPIMCPVGYYCPLGTDYFSLLCDEGYYCPEGSASPQVIYNAISWTLLFLLLKCAYYRYVLTEHTKLALAKVIATFVQLVITAHQAPPYLWSVLQDFTVLTVLNPAFRMHAQLEPIQITQVALQYLAVQNARLVCIATKMD